MAIQTANVSIQLKDGDESVKAFDQPIKFDDATATIASLIAWIKGLVSAVDVTVDGQAMKARVCINIGLPPGIKTAPDAQGINERTGLLTYVVTGSTNAYGVDIPGVKPTLFSGDDLPIAGVVASLDTYLTTVSGTIAATDRYGNALASVSKHKKTFRE